jgi:phage baseplate assembly protein V
MKRLSQLLAQRMRGLITRGVVTLIDDSQAVQLLQVKLAGGRTLSGVERFETYGLTSRLLPQDADGKAAEVVAVFINGSPDHPVVVASADRRHRPDDMDPGDVVLYDSRGNRVHLKSGSLEVTAATELVLKVGSSEIRIDGTSILIKAATIDMEQP